MLKRLTLKNVKKHENITVNFTHGVNVIVGGNYRGKSSLLHGVLLALFGVRAVPGNHDDILHRGATTWATELEFEANGNDYVVTRSKSSASLTENGEVIATGQTSVTSRVETIVGLTSSRFTQLRYAEQKKTEAMLTLGRAELHKIIEEVGGVDVVNKTIARMAEDLTKMNGALSVLESADTELKAAEQAVDSLTENATDRVIGELTQNVADLEEQISITTSNRAGAVSHSEVVGRKAKAHSDWKKLGVEKLEAVSSTKATYEAAVEQLDNVKKSMKQMKIQTNEQAAEVVAEQKEKKAQLEAMKVAQDERTSILTLREAKSKSVQKAQADLAQAELKAPSDEEMVRLGVDLEQATLNYSKAAESVSDIISRLEEIESILQGGVCSTCGRPHDNTDPAHLEALRKEHRKLEKTLPARNVDKDSRKKAVDDITAKVNEGVLYRDRLASSQKALESATEELNSVPATPVDYSEQMTIIQNELTANSTELTLFSNNYQEYSKALSKSLEAEHKATVALEAYETYKAEEPEDVDSEAVVAATDKVTTFSAKLTELTTERAAVREKLSGLVREVEDATGRLETAKARYEQYRAKLKEKAKVTELLKYLRDNRDRFVQSIWDGVGAYASDFSSACTSGAISSVVRKDNGDFYYTENGETFSVEGCASGAQKSIMGLGIQLALAELLPTSMTTVMLDEPGADMDVTHSAALASLLRTTGKQVIMISHRDMDASVADNAINV